MIEKLISNELTKKRWRRFKARRSAFASAIIFLTMVVMTFIAPMLANNKPLYLSYKGESYFPVFNDYHPKEFGLKNTLVVNYKKLELALPLLA